ncbi:MAG: cyclic pyranopterin monophosphate synthase MoaC [Fusobacteriaceae bacterium]
MKEDFTHFNSSGRALMVDVSEKKNTIRTATATGKIFMAGETIQAVRDGKMKKGDVLAVAQIAGVMGAKKTSDIIPMCHNIFISKADLEFEIMADHIVIFATVKTEGQTGIEMEALTAVTTAALTVYDMCKAIDKNMRIEDIKLLTKTGGKSDYRREEE